MCMLTYSQARRCISKWGKTPLQSIVVFRDVLLVFRCYWLCQYKYRRLYIGKKAKIL